MSHPTLEERHDPAFKKEAGALVWGALIGLWVYPMWLVYAGIVILGGDRPIWPVPGTQIDIRLLFIALLWIWQFLAVCWIGWFLQNTVRTSVAVALHLNPILGAIGLGFMIAAVRRKLEKHRLRLTLFGISPENWSAFLSREDHYCTNCGEPLSPTTTACPLCGEIDTEPASG